MGAVIVLVVVLVIVLVSVTNKPVITKPTGFGYRAAPASLVSALEGVPASSFATAGTTVSSDGPYAAQLTVLKHQPALLIDGKPGVIYVGSEYCPYCAASRWPLTLALMRFGTFKNLGITKSGSADIYPGTDSLSYWKATYSSPYIAFSSVEQCTDLVAPTSDDSKPAVQACEGYMPLESFKAGTDFKNFEKYDNTPYETQNNAGGIPFVNFGNKWEEDGTFINPPVLGGFTWTGIAQSLGNPAASPAQVILAGANYYSAMICKMTGNKPGSVCDMPVVKQAAASLPS